MADSQSSNQSDFKPRSNSMSQASESSQTAAEYIKEQLSLEAEAREALPYQFDTCTRDLGPLRQSLYACLTCNPPPTNPSDPFVPAGVCYSCSISCHGEHQLVELFSKRNFVCDCGSTRTPDTSPCTLRLNSVTGQKGDVKGQEAAKDNKYNQNFRNQFCGCSELYDPHQEKGTMFQCLGLGTTAEGGCGEDWWHPECVVGLTRDEYKKSIEKPKDEAKQGEQGSNDAKNDSAASADIVAAIRDTNGADGNDIAGVAEEQDDEETPLPPGFPPEDDFDLWICYKCVEANPWIKKYAGSTGFLPPFYFDAALNSTVSQDTSATTESTNGESKKRKAREDEEDSSITTSLPAPLKRQKSEDPAATLSSVPETTTLPLTPKKTETATPVCKVSALPPLPPQATTARFSLFLKPDFRDYLCRCPECFPLLKPHPQLLEEEDTYEPPMSEDGDNDGAQSVGTGSLLDRGEAAFNNMDRVRAIQGAMAYAHLRDKLTTFLKPFAESGAAVGAEDIKSYFEKLRGDESGILEAAGSARANKDNEGDGDGGADGDSRKEQSGY